MTKFRLLIKLLIVAIFISSPSTLALPSLNSAPNDDVFAGIKALHRAPEKEMARLKLLLASQQTSPKRHEWNYLYALGKEKRGEYSDALAYLEDCINDPYTEGLMLQRAKMLKAKVLSNTGDAQSAIAILNSVKRWAMNHNVIQLNIGALMTMGYTFERITEPKLALDNYLLAYDMATQFKTQVPAPHIAGLIGTVYLQLSQYEDAKIYLDEAYRFAVKKGNAVTQGHFAQKIASVERELANFVEAEKFYDLTIGIAEKNKDTPLLARAYLGKGKLLLDRGSSEEVISAARANFEKAIMLSQPQESKRIYFEALMAFSRLLLSTGNTAAAIEKIKAAENAIRDVKPGYLHLEAARQKLTIMEAYGDEQSIVNALKQYISLNETVTESLDKSRLQVIRTLYELEEIQEENSSLKAITQLQADKLALNNQRSFLLLVVTSLFVLLSILLFFMYAKRMRYQRKLEKIATTDSLTRLFNRGKTIELLEARMNELPHKSNKCAVAMLDIDLFKTINDKYGHCVGDDALKLFAATAKQNFSASVDMGRLGGEEFLFIFQGVDVSETVKQLETFSQSLKDASIKALGGEIKLTFSAGVLLLTEAQSISSVLEKTDGALYEAKETGRDKIVVFTCL